MTMVVNAVHGRMVQMMLQSTDGPGRKIEAAFDQREVSPARAACSF